MGSCSSTSITRNIDPAESNIRTDIAERNHKLKMAEKPKLQFGSSSFQIASLEASADKKPITTKNLSK